MKNTTLTTTTKRGTVKIKSQQAMHSPMFNDLDAVEHKLNKLWDMFKVQLERNYELMNIVNKQTEQIINQSGMQHVIPVAETPAAPPAEIKQEIKADEKPFIPLTYEMLNTLTKRYRDVFIDAPARIDAIQSHISFLYTLYHLGEVISPFQLFMAANVTNITGYRYMNYLKQNRLIQYKRKGTDTVFGLSEAGRKFIDGKILNREQYYEIIKHPYIDTNGNMVKF